MNPLMSGPLLEKEKLIVVAAVMRVLRNAEDLRASNWDAMPDSLACRLNVKYHVRRQTPLVAASVARDRLFDFSTAADMKKRIK